MTTLDSHDYGIIETIKRIENQKLVPVGKITEIEKKDLERLNYKGRYVAPWLYKTTQIKSLSLVEPKVWQCSELTTFLEDILTNRNFSVKIKFEQPR